MPELPEVETVCRTLRRHVVGQTIAHIRVLNGSLRWPIDLGAVQRLAAGRRVEAVRRRAKYILLDLQPDPGLAQASTSGSPTAAAEPSVLAVHLGMSGILQVTPGTQPLRRHDHVVLQLYNSAVEVRFNDPRRFGSVHCFLRRDQAQHPLFAHLGAEPLDGAAFTGAYLRSATRGAQRSIKQVIMDARVVVGVGNIYASEALWRAGISPRTTAGRLSGPRLARLSTAIVATLRDAIDQGGTTLRDFSDADAASGGYGKRLRVYGREGLACYGCGQQVRRLVQQGRSTFWCSSCQSS